MKKKYKLLLLDLDGTLIDSRLDIAGATNATLALWKIPPLPVDAICKFVGSGVKELLKMASQSAGVSQAQLSQGIAYFKEIYAKNCLKHTTWYPQVPSTLKTLQGHIPLALITNKPRDLTEAILKGLNGLSYFSQIVAEGEGFPKKPDPSGVLYLMKQAGVVPEEALLVGDSRIDWETAKAAKVDLGLVTYGLTPPEEIKKLSSRYTLNAFLELEPIVLSTSATKS